MKAVKFDSLKEETSDELKLDDVEMAPPQLPSQSIQQMLHAAAVVVPSALGEQLALSKRLVRRWQMVAAGTSGLAVFAFLLWIAQSNC